MVARKQGGLAGWPAARCLYTHPTARSDDLAARAVDLGDTSAARALARLIERHGISREAEVFFESEAFNALLGMPQITLDEIEWRRWP